MPSKTATMTIYIPQNENPLGGFYNTIHGKANKKRAWNCAVAEFYNATGCVPEAVAVWLGSTRGRHFADTVNDRMQEYRKLNRGRVPSARLDIEDAVEACVDEYFGSDDGTPFLRRKREFVSKAYEWYSDELSSLVALQSENG